MHAGGGMGQKAKDDAPVGRRPAGAGNEEHRAERADAMTSVALPALLQDDVQRHWLPADDGGAELITAAFGTCPKPSPRQAVAGAPVRPDSRRDTALPLDGKRTAPSRLWATVLLVLLGLALLLATGSTPP